MWRSERSGAVRIGLLRQLQSDLKPESHIQATVSHNQSRPQRSWNCTGNVARDQFQRCSRMRVGCDFSKLIADPNEINTTEHHGLPSYCRQVTRRWYVLWGLQYGPSPRQVSSHSLKTAPQFATTCHCVATTSHLRLRFETTHRVTVAPLSKSGS